MSKMKELKEPRKGVDSSRQQDGGHGSRISAKKCVTTYLPNESVPKMDDANVFLITNTFLSLLDLLWSDDK